MTEARTALESLRLRFAWPTQRPDVAAVPWVMDYGGKYLIRHLIAVRRPRVIVEIGAFMGGSVRQWLEVSPELTVVAIDPWPQKKSPDPFCDSHPIGRLHAGQFREPDGLYLAFLATMWEHRNRVIPLRGNGCDMLPVLHAIGLRPDLIYIDADKRGAEIAICDELFPEAIICGDDWLWRDGWGYPSQKPVHDSARRRRRVVKTASNTWLIDDRPWTAAELMIWLGCLPQSLVRRLRGWMRARRGCDSAGSPATPARGGAEPNQRVVKP
jgi:predicted O-methyltransferase YrrM